MRITVDRLEVRVSDPAHADGARATARAFHDALEAGAARAGGRDEVRVGRLSIDLPADPAAHASLGAQAARRVLERLWTSAGEGEG
ncbi:MAG TPA: hypothetical protein VF142_21110 [Longimicrobium sp.]